MPKSSGSGDGDDHGAAQGLPEEGGEDKAHQQERTASELSDRTAEYVDRRYDATKETYLDERERNATGRDEESGETDG